MNSKEEYQQIRFLAANSSIWDIYRDFVGLTFQEQRMILNELEEMEFDFIGRMRLKELWKIFAIQGYFPETKTFSEVAA